MFIHRRNVEQYANGRPRPRASQPVGTSAGAAQRRPVVSSSSALHSGTRRAAREDAGADRSRRALYDFSSDSEEIVVEEIFSTGPSRSVGSAKEARQALATPPTQHTALETASFNLTRPGVPAASLPLSTTRVEGRRSASVNSATQAAVRRSQPGELVAGVGGVSPLTHVSPGESRISDVFVHRSTREDEAKGNATYLPDERGATEDDEPAEENVSRLLMVHPTSEAQNAQTSQRHSLTRIGKDMASNQVQVPEGDLSMVAATGSLTRLQRRLTSPEVQSRSLSHPCPLSDLERTLTAATKALTAAAAREAQRRADEAEADEARARAITVPSVEMHLIHDTLLSTALKEKVLLFEAYFAGLQSTGEAMGLCAVLYRRDAERARREADGVSREQERATQQKVSLYRQHVASEAQRENAERKHQEELRAAEDRLAEAFSTISDLRNAAELRETALQEEQRARHDEKLRCQQDAHASALELRALQRAHGEATQRWMTLQVSYSILQQRHEKLRRRWATGLPCRHVALRTGADPSSLPNGVPRVTAEEDCLPLTPRAGVYAMEPLEGCTTAQQRARASDEETIPREVSTNHNAASEEPTALEALLARTPLDRDTLASSMPSQRGDSGALDGEENRVVGTRLCPPTRGGFTSPPDTPLIGASLSTSATNAKSEESASHPIIHSPDVKPADARPFLQERVHDEQKGEPSCAVEPTRQSSSFRPSRLNSVASTRRGSSLSLVQPTHSPIDDFTAEMRAQRNSANNGALTSNADVDECLDADWERRLREAAAQAVQQELSRLVHVALSGPKGGKMASTAAAGATKRGLAERRPRVLPTSAEQSYISTPRLDGRSVTDLDESGIAQQERTEETTTAIPALQWMRVCETAYFSARICHQVAGKLQSLMDTLTLRIQLLDEKDWNKTMARRFIAVDHTAALKRLTGKVEAIVQGTTVSTSVEATASPRRM